MNMAGLSEVMKNRIADVLGSSSFAKQDFAVTYGDESNPIVTVTYLGSPEYRFVINSTGKDAFTTSECPGIRSDAAESFQRSSFELCINALKAWVERINNRQDDWMLDEFGGAADTDPSYDK